MQPEITQPLSNRTCLYIRLVGGESAEQNDCYGRLGERGEGMNRGSVQIKTETGETAVILAELLAHNACTFCCKRLGGAGVVQVRPPLCPPYNTSGDP